jgi:20S proteasome subunit alpha 7
MVEPSGLAFRYFGCAAGKGANAAKTEIEKILNKRGDAGLTCAEAVEELAYILYTIRDPSKDKPFEIEMGWLSATNDFKHTLVPSDIVAAAETKAKATLSGDAVPVELASMDI